MESIFVDGIVEELRCDCDPKWRNRKKSLISQVLGEVQVSVVDGIAG